MALLQLWHTANRSGGGRQAVASLHALWRSSWTQRVGGGVIQTTRTYAALAEVPEEHQKALTHIRNIGISAHIDSGKTTLTERILYYTGMISEIHEVKGKDGVGATMDSMELERERGITIQSAATYCQWRDKQINIIDTPGHVDFTVEVERSLRVLDGAILVLCGVGGVQSQTITVDRQMRRYNVPRLIFINKLDRPGANPWKVIAAVREKLRINCAAVQVPIGLEDHHAGVVDLVTQRALIFDGAKGSAVVEKPIPAHLAPEVEAKRAELIEKLCDVDDQLAEKFLNEEAITSEDVAGAIRRSVIALKFAPVFMGSAYKNKGVQALLDGVNSYLPCPTDVDNFALDIHNNDAPVRVPCNPAGPFIGYAFKLEEGRFGQLTYMRMYSGTVKKGGMVTNLNSGKKIRVPRLVRMHSNELQDVQSASAGDIVALFGVECASGDTFTDGSVDYAMTSIKVPEPVMSLAVSPKSTEHLANFQRALQRFQKEDPTFRVNQDSESGEIIISGMGELHLEIYVERMKREYKVDCEVGKPKVNFRETVRQKSAFNYLHKKQSGGSGQYGRVVGYIEPLEEDSEEKYVFDNQLVGNNIPPEFHPACEKGFREAANSGALIGAPVENVRVVLTDGASHAVDSSELAFRLACIQGFRQAFTGASPTILEPIMKVEVTIPVEYQGNVMGDLNRRKGMILDSSQNVEDAVIVAQVPLNDMFGYSSALRSITSGKGEFTMEYSHHSPVSKELQDQLTSHYQKTKSADKK